MATVPTYGHLEPFQPETESFTAYSERLKLFFTANKIEDNRQVAVLLSALGTRLYSLLRTLVAPGNPKDKTVDEILAVLKGHLDPAPIVIAERFKFYQRVQEPQESVTQFVAELRRLATHCDFGDKLNEALRDRLVCGLKPSLEGAQKKLLAMKDLTLKKAMEGALSYETIESKSKEMQHQPQPSISVDMMSAGMKQNKEKNTSKERALRSAPPCMRCGRKGHSPSTCRFKDLTCHRCQKKGHIASACRAVEPRRNQKSRYETQEISEGKEESPGPGSPEDDFGLFQINSVAAKMAPITVTVTLNGKTTKMTLDTGAAVTVIPEEVIKTINGVTIQPTDIILTTYTAEQIEVVGCCRLTVGYKAQVHELVGYVVKGGRSCLFGRDWLGVIHLDWQSINAVHHKSKEKVQQLLEKYSTVFDGQMGTMKGFEAKLQVKEGVKPRFMRAWMVPFALEAAVENELLRLENLGILEKVSSSEWATPIVAVPKKEGNIQICGDYKHTINPALNIDVHPLPHPEEIFTTLTGGERFTKLDLTHAYQQMLLDNESRQYLTINTHKGLYRYTRLPFGVSSAPAIFQRTMDAILAGIPKVACYIDDIIITGEDEESHLKNLEEVLKRLTTHGVKAQQGKCSFFGECIQYLGHIISREGIMPLPDRLQVILKAPLPKCAQELRSFLGFINYYRRFVPNLSSILAPLNDLLRVGAKWQWSNGCSKAVEIARKQLAAAKPLVHFNPSLPIQLATDTSSYGLGAVISHKFPDGTERPVAFASRTMTTAERNYAQIEKEALAIIFGVKKFHKYLYGRQFSLLTDHKPLTIIFGSKADTPPLAAARLQWWALTLSAYSYDISYRRSELHANADGLSRLPIPIPVTETKPDVSMMFNITQLASLPLSHSQLKAAIRADVILARVLSLTREGWLESCPGDDELVPYWRHRHELTVEAGCVLLGARAVVPVSLRATVLRELHEGHPGASRMKSLARSKVWWPGMDHDIERLGKSCSACLEVKSALPPVPLHPWEWPHKPWSRIHIDFMGPLHSKMYLVVIDAHSKWPEVWPMGSTTAEKTIGVMKHLFSLYRLPDQVVSDNGPQFASTEFQEFLRQHGVKHYRSAPYHPATNGLVERFNKTLKQALKTGLLEGKPVSEALRAFLLSYRTTPHTVTGTPPSDLFLKRSLKTRLDLLRPTLQQQIQDKQWAQKQVHDRKGKERQWVVGDTVWIRDYRKSMTKWQKGNVTKILGTRTYLVTVETGLVVRRHADQMQSYCGPQEDSKGKTTEVDHNWSTGLEQEDLEEATQQQGETTQQQRETNQQQEEETQQPEEIAPQVRPETHEPERERRYPLRERRPTRKPGFVRL